MFVRFLCVLRVRLYNNDNDKSHVPYDEPRYALSHGQRAVNIGDAECDKLSVAELDGQHL